MILDHRTYTFRPGRVQRWLDKYERDGLPIQRRHLGDFVGMFATEIGNMHQVVFLWAYESLADREARRARMQADPAWQTFIGEVWELDAIVEQRVSVLRPVPFSPLR